MKRVTASLAVLWSLALTACPGPADPVPTVFYNSNITVDVAHGRLPAKKSSFPVDAEFQLLLIAEESGAPEMRAAGKSPAFAQADVILPQWGTEGLLYAELPESFPRSLYERGEAAWTRNTFLVLQITQASQPTAAPTHYCAHVRSAYMEQGNSEKSAMHFRVELKEDQSLPPAGAQLAAGVAPFFCETAYFNAAFLGIP